MRFFVFVYCILIPLLDHKIAAQSSELFLLNLLKIDEKYEVRNISFLSHFNKGGYTNQPFFENSHKVWITAAPQSELSASDLYWMDLPTKSLYRFSATPDREYSPMPSLSHPGMLNCILVDVGNQNKQILWQYPISRQGGGKLWMPFDFQVGYYCELPGNQLAVFEVAEPSKLWICNLQSGEKRMVTSKVGRCLQPAGDGNLFYVHKISEDYWFIKKLDLHSMTSEIVKKTLPDSEDFVVLADQSILMAQGSKIYHLGIGTESQWREIADLRPSGIHNIKRMAFNKVDQLIITNQPAP